MKIEWKGEEKKEKIPLKSQEIYEINHQGEKCLLLVGWDGMCIRLGNSGSGSGDIQVYKPYEVLRRVTDKVKIIVED